MRFLLLAFSLPVAAAPARADELTLERIFASPALSGPTPRLLKLSPDGRLATLLRNRPNDRDRYTPETELDARVSRTGAAFPSSATRISTSSSPTGRASALTTDGTRIYQQRYPPAGSASR